MLASRMASLISPPCWLPSTREEEICSPLNQPSPFLSVIFPSNKSRFDLLSLQLKPKICSNLVVAAARRNHSHGVDPVGKQDGRACLVAVAGHNIGPARGLDPVLNPAGQAWISSPEEDACACHGSEHAAVPILSAATAVYLHGLDRYLPGEEVDLVLQDVESLDGIHAFVVCTGGGLLDGNIGDDSFAAHHRIGVVLCWDLEHYQGVVKVVSCKCFCCIMDARQDEDHSEGDDSPPFGLILRRQLRASMSMIPRYNGRDDFKLGSVKLSSDLQLNYYQPQV